MNNDYKIKNPIIPGFYPDPSICRVGNDYYIANSSFSFFPGIPLFHSRDLAHWECIGYALNDPQQLRLNPERLSGGLFAPTIRYHEGLFYVIVGNMTTGENILVTAEDPRGPWSDVHLIDGVGGDPSLFWDDDGTCWCSYSKMGGPNGGIVNRQLDLTTFRLVGEEYYLWNGNAYDAHSPESSHIYKKDGWYYLLIAEGGTEHYHATTIARSKNLNGPYKNYRGNPILSHGHLSMYHEIVNIGHSDFVETQNGAWYMVSLASRPYGGYHKNLGRETFIMPVIWESDWPIVCPGTGKCEMEYPAPELPEFPVADLPEADDFDAKTLSWQWNTLGTPVGDVYRLEDSRLYIKTAAVPLENWAHHKFGGFPEDPEERRKMFEAHMAARKNAKAYAMGFVGRRQQHFSYTVETSTYYAPQGENDTAGLVIIQDSTNQLRIEIGLEQGKKVARVVKFYNVIPHAMMGDVIPEMDVEEGLYSQVQGCVEIPDEEVVLRITAKGQSNSFYVNDLPVAVNVNGSFMGSETCGGFVGAYIGMFASSNTNGKENAEPVEQEAAFDWFTYVPE